MFKYRLDPLLQFRKMKEEEAQRGLAEADRVYYGFVNEGERALGRKVESILALSKKIGDIVNPRLLGLYDNFRLGMNADAEKSGRQAISAMEIVDMERDKLVQIMKSKKTLELHKEMLGKRYNDEITRKERIESDDIAMTRFGRKERVL